MAAERVVSIEGLSPDEILALSREELDALIFCGQPVVFRAGTAEILACFKIDGSTLVLELAHIDGGGEGVLPTLAALAERFARREGLSGLDWRVHAVHCARPNRKLRRVLERRGFRIEDVPGLGECYRLVQPISENTAAKMRR